MSALDKLLARERKLELQLASVRQEIVDAQDQAARNLAARCEVEDRQRSAERKVVLGAVDAACAAATMHYKTPIAANAVTAFDGPNSVRSARRAAILLARAGGVPTAAIGRELHRSVQWVHAVCRRRPDRDTAAIVAIATGTRPEVRS